MRYTMREIYYEWMANEMNYKWDDSYQMTFTVMANDFHINIYKYFCDWNLRK